MLKILRGKKLLSSLSAKKNTAVVLMAATIVAVCSGFTYASQNVVTIADNGVSSVQIKTSDTNVGKILSKQGIVLNEGDELNYDLSDDIHSNAVIEIHRAVGIDVNYMGENKSYRTAKNTVREVLDELGIKVDANDTVVPSLDSAIGDGTQIEIKIYDYHTVTVQEDVAYTTYEYENTALASGERRIAQQGKNGVIEYEYNIKYENGIEVSRDLVREEKLSEPVDEIVEYGSEEVWQLGVVPASAPVNYSRVDVFKATAYDASPADNGIWAGKTSTGMPLVYGVVAVDPKVIPYGTKMYIESVDGQYKYGYAIAGDCGGAIKGKRVDLFFDSRSTCYSFGRRDVKIYFID